MVESHRAGVFCNPVDPSDFPRKIRPLMVDRDFWMDSCNRARQLGEEQFSRELLARKLEEVLVMAAENKKGNS